MLNIFCYLISLSFADGETENHKGLQLITAE